LSGRAPHAKGDLFARHTERVPWALDLGELDFYSYGLVKFFTDQLHRPGSRGEVAYTLEELHKRLRWPLKGTEMLRRRLHEVGPEGQGWIDFDEVKQGQRGPWIFRLARAAIDGEEARPPRRPPRDFHFDSPSELEVTSEHPLGVEAPTPHPERDVEVPGPPSTPALEKRREKRDSESSFAYAQEDSARGSENARHPRAPFEETLEQAFARLIAAEQGQASGLEPGDEEKGAALEGRSRDGTRPPRVVRSLYNGELLWSGEPAAGEAGVLADADAFVAAGLGKWREQASLCASHAHRAEGRDWRNDSGRLICGICHPRAFGP
jgi:hypothetical protein